jgi:lysophospholipase L1-like esterase
MFTAIRRAWIRRGASAIAALGITTLAAGFLPPTAAQAATSGAVIDSSNCMANWLPANDDNSTSAVLLPFKVNFYGATYERMYVNNNGNVTFDAPLSAYTPFGLTGTRTPIIAPFFADVDTRVGGGSGIVGYGWGNTVYEGRRAVCVSWKSVGYYNYHSDKTNTFQLLLVEHGNSGDLDIVFNYDQVQWETGDASGGRGGLGGSSARAGFSSGSGQAGTFFEMPGSGVNGAFLDSAATGLANNSTESRQPGRHVFRIRGGAAPLTRYVALGDSYSSGFGMGSYATGTHPDTWGGDNDCQRSTLAYSHIVAKKLGLDLDFNACQGGVTQDFYTPRAYDEDLHEDDEGVWNEKPQLTHLDNSTRLVTFTIGGNDSGFATIYEECALGMELLPWNDCYEDDKVTKPLAAAFTRLDGGGDNGDRKLQKVVPYPTVFSGARARAPYAERVVIGYPTFFTKDGTDWSCQLIEKADQRWIHEKTLELNAIIKRNAELNGFRYVDPNPYFAGHEFCSANEWFYGVTEPGKVHPTPPGHAAIAQAILKELTSDDRPHFMVMPYETATTSFNVNSPQDAVNVGIEWPGSDIQLTLKSPSGKTYNRTAQPDGATNTHGPTWDQLTVPHPELGTWQVLMYGADVDPQGEEAKLRVTQTEAPNRAPVGAFDMSVDGTVLKLDASKSTDPDGTITSYDWYVRLADGTERVLHGANAGTTLPAGQRFKATLVITDNDAASSFTSRTAVAVAIDVKPGSADNPINVKSKGVTPIAILSTEDFDATRVQVGSVRVGPAAATVDKASVQDVNGDGRADQLLHVSTPALGLRSGDTTLSLSGTLRDGVPFVGTDQVRVLQ